MKPAVAVGAAFTLFALLHSLTVSGRFKALVQGLAGARWMRAWYRLSFTVFSAFISALLFYVYISQPDTFIYRPGTAVLWAMHAAQFLGVWLMVAAMRPFRAGYFTGISQAKTYISTGQTGGDIEGMPKGSLVSSGVYGVVRHPMYLAGIAIFVFEPNVTLNCVVLRVLATAYFVYGALIEDGRLVESFGAEYEAYRKRVPMFNIVSGVMRKYGGK